MKYVNEKVRGIFNGDENYATPLALLEQCFKKAGLDIEFVCDIAADSEKIVSVYRYGFLQKMLSIEGDSPAQAVKDVAKGVRL